MKKPANVNVLVLWVLAGLGGVAAVSLYITVAWNLFFASILRFPTMHFENGLGLAMSLALLVGIVLGLREVKA